MSTQVKTYTLDELVGPEREWRHWRKVDSTVLFCGIESTKAATGPAIARGRAPYPDPNGRPDCPDCLRIHMGGAK